MVQAQSLNKTNDPAVSFSKFLTNYTKMGMLRSQLCSLTKVAMTCKPILAWWTNRTDSVRLLLSQWTIMPKLSAAPDTHRGELTWGRGHHHFGRRWCQAPTQLQTHATDHLRWCITKHHSLLRHRKVQRIVWTGHGNVSRRFRWSQSHPTEARQCTIILA